ncbi:MAG TPA: hypothetical protein PK668_11160 [Myxococcota bacterium]|nr:hypothetical protein [Myxococcota bacterium]HRY93276.1 hypothetical protein [Myxococcota bacterium]HSA23767.1 hypothetical protein [Myxococcota bacterium]
MPDPLSISAALLSFARPLLRAVGQPEREEELDAVLRVAVTIWNAVVLEQSGQAGRYLDQARRQIEEWSLPAAAQLFEALVEHKHQAFEDDLRLILDYRVMRDDGGRLGVEVTAGPASDLPGPA